MTTSIRSLVYHPFALLILFGAMVSLVVSKENGSPSTEVCACRDREMGNSSAALIASQMCCEAVNGVWENNYCTITDKGQQSETCSLTDGFGDCCSFRMQMLHKCIEK